MLRPAPAFCLPFLLFLGPNRLILCLLGSIFQTYVLAILTWVGARVCLLTLFYFAKNTRSFGSCTRLGFGSLWSKILFLGIFISFCSSFVTRFFPQNVFCLIPFKTSPPIALAADTNKGFASVPRIGKKPPFCIFLPPKCQILCLI